jgi:SAM-dependent methyltransferase
VEGFAILRCRRCGLGRTELPADFDPLRQYDEGYFQGARADGYADYPGSERVLRREFRAGLQHLLRHGPSSGKLLEVGCAYGYFLEEARARFTGCGVEPAEGAAAAARARGLDVASGTAHPEFLATRGPFDAFVLLDVIEHVACPGELLLTLARHARPGAALLLSTGDWGSLSARLLGRRWRLMTPPQHLWFFTRAALQRLLARAGFSVLDVRHPWKRVPLELIAYQLGRSLGLQPALQRVPWPDLGLPLNLFDALRLVARYTGLAEPESRGAPPTAPGQ